MKLHVLNSEVIQKVGAWLKQNEQEEAKAEKERRCVNAVVRVILSDGNLSKPMRYNTARQKHGELYAL